MFLEDGNKKNNLKIVVEINNVYFIDLISLKFLYELRENDLIIKLNIPKGCFYDYINQVDCLRDILKVYLKYSEKKSVDGFKQFISQILEKDGTLSNELANDIEENRDELFESNFNISDKKLYNKIKNYK